MASVTMTGVQRWRHVIAFAGNTICCGKPLKLRRNNSSRGEKANFFLLLKLFHSVTFAPLSPKLVSRARPPETIILDFPNSTVLSAIQFFDRGENKFYPNRKCAFSQRNGGVLVSSSSFKLFLQLGEKRCIVSGRDSRGLFSPVPLYSYRRTSVSPASPDKLAAYFVIALPGRLLP